MSVHNHAAAQKSSGAIFHNIAGEGCRKRPGRARNALRASEAVRGSDVMVNYIFTSIHSLLTSMKLAVFLW